MLSNLMIIVIFILNFFNIFERGGIHITKDRNLIYNKKLTNKLFYYSSIKNIRKDLYHDIKINYFDIHNKIIRNNKEIFTYFCKNNPVNFLNLQSCYRKINFLLNLVKNGCRILKFLSEEEQTNEIVYESLKLDIKQIEYAKYEFVNEFIKQNFNLEKTFKSLA